MCDGKESQEDGKETPPRDVDEGTPARPKIPLKGKDAGQKDSKDNEADRGCGASKGVRTRHSARTPALEVSNVNASFGL
jgi:hypothetical protein